MKLKLALLLALVMLAATSLTTFADGPGGTGVIPVEYPPGTWQTITVTYDRLQAYIDDGWTFIRQTDMWNGVSYMPAALIQKFIPPVTQSDPVLLVPIPQYLFDQYSPCWSDPSATWGPYGCQSNSQVN
jgi:hypothetical protein